MSDNVVQFDQAKASAVMGRVPPHNLDAERSLLGGILLDGQAFDDVQGKVSADEFYRDAHRKIFEAMTALAVRSEPIDRITLKDALTAAGAFEAVGGDAYVDLLDKFVPTAANLGYYAQIIREKACVRRVIEACGSICALGYEQHGDVAEFLNTVQSRILTAADLSTKATEPEDLRTVIPRVFKQLETDYERQTSVTGISSGIADLDRITCGWQNKDLVIVGARPGFGKTTSTLGFARYAARRLRLPSLLFSMEMPKEAVTRKCLSAEAEVDGQRLRTGQLHEADWAKLANAAGVLAEAGLIVDDERGLSAMAIASKARKVKRRLAAQNKQLGLIVVDYLTLMALDDTRESVSTRVGRNALRLRDLAGELDLPIILLAQLNRESTKGSNKPRKPVLSDLRDSGEIEQHADLVVFIHCEDGHYSFIVEKQRNGLTGEVSVTFDKAHQRFFGAQPHEEEVRQMRLQEPPPHTDEDAR